MAETRIDFVVKAKDDGASATLDKVGKGIDKVGAKAKAATGGEGTGGFFRRMKAQGEGMENFANVLKGAGSLGVVNSIGRGLQRAPELFAKMAAEKRVGMFSASESAAEMLADAIPVAGDLAKGFRAARDAPALARQAEKDRIREEKDEAARRAQEWARRGRELREGAQGDALRARATDMVANAPDAQRGIQSARAAYFQLDQQLKLAHKAMQGTGPLNDLAAVDEAHDRMRSDALKAMAREERDFERGRVERAKQAEDAIVDAKVQANSAWLEFQGRDADAAMMKLDAQTKKTIDGINRAYTESVRKGERPDAGQRESLIQQQQRIRFAEKARINEIDRVARDQKTFETNRSGLDQLRQMSELNMGITRQEVDRLSIMEETAERRRELNELLSKENLTASQRASLEGQRNNLGAIEAERLARIGEGKFSGGLAPTEQSRFLTGIAAIAKDQDPTRQLIKVSEQTAANTAAIKTAIENLPKNLSGLASYKGPKP